MWEKVRSEAARERRTGEGFSFFSGSRRLSLTGQGLTSCWGRPESPSLTALFDTSAAAPGP